jgi:hypothetical protein
MMPAVHLIRPTAEERVVLVEVLPVLITKRCLLEVPRAARMGTPVRDPSDAHGADVTP